MSAMTSDSHFDLKDFVAVLIRRRRLIVALVTVSVVGCWGALQAIEPVYQATAEIVLEASDARLADAAGELRETEQDRSAVETHIDLIRSRALLRGVADELALVDDPEFGAVLASSLPPATGGGLIPEAQAGEVEGASAGGDAVAAGVFEAGTPLDRFVAKLTGVGGGLLAQAGELLGDDDGPPVVETEAERVDVAISALRANLDVERSGHGLVFKISAASGDPAKSAAIANTVADRYIRWTYDLKQGETTEAVAFLTMRTAELDRRVSEAEQAVVEYRRTHNLAAAPQEDSVLMQLTQLHSQLILAGVERAGAEADLAEARKLLARGTAEAAAAMSSPLLADLRAQEAALQRDQAELATVYGDRHPQRINLDARIAGVRAKIVEEVERIVGDLNNKVAVARAREGELQRSVQGLEGARSGQNDASVSLHDLERELEAARSIHAASMGQLKKLNEQQQVLRPSARFISEAQAPNSPSFPQPKLMLFAAFVGSSMVASLLAFVLEHLDTRLRSARQVRHALGVPTLTMVPLVQDERGKPHPSPLIHALEKPRSYYAESLRVLHAACALADLDQPSKVVALTSSLPEEGKTTLALGLAATAARAGLETVVVDMDLHRGRVAEKTGMPGRALGVMDYLTGVCQLDDVTRAHPEIPNLTVVASGTHADQTAAAFGSNRVKAMIAALRGRYDFVVLDTPPLLPVNDTRLLAPLADGVVFVVRWNQTREEAARAALGYLSDERIKLFGAVINQVDVKRHARDGHGDALQYYKKYDKYYLN